jgi:hypothetical protein
MILLIKILETSLILKFHPKLNTSNKVVFKHFEWNDEYFTIYSKNNKISEYLKTTKYEIYVLSKESRLIEKS